MERSVVDSGTLVLEDLRAFIATLEAGSLTGAAERLSVPKSTVSRRLARLEESLDARLFDRTKGGLRLTDLGRIVVEPARNALAEVRFITDALAGARSAPAGRLRVAASADLAAYDRLWVDFAAEHPQVELETLFTHRSVDVAGEGFHLALRAGPDRSLVAQQIGGYGLRAVASQAYVAERGRPSRDADLPNHDLVLMKPGASFEPNSRVGRTAGRRLVLDDLAAVLCAARRGLGIAFLPAYLCDPFIEAGDLAVMLDRYDPLWVPVFAVYPDRPSLPSAQRAFVAFARNVFATEPRLKALATP